MNKKTHTRTREKNHTCPTCGALVLFAVTASKELAALVDDWIEGLEIEGRASSYTRKLRQRTRDYILPFFRSRGDITTYNVRIFHQGLMKGGLSSKSCKHVIDTLRAFVNHLCRLEAIEREPLYPDIRPARSREARWLSEDDQARVIAALDVRHRAIFCLLIESGIRPGEVCALKVRDLRAGSFHVERARGESGGIKGTKTGKRLVIPLREDVEAFIRAGRGPALPEVWLFVDSRNGEPYTQQKLYALWRRACGRASVRYVCLYEATRHSKASQARRDIEERGREELRAVLGHTGASTTLRHYALSEDRRVGHED